MLEHFVSLFLEILIPLCELMGISIVAISACASFWQYARSLIKRIPCNVKFQLANGLALSLEFKMAAEILKTVLIRDFGELLVLGAVIILRALLSDSALDSLHSGEQLSLFDPTMEDVRQCITGQI